MALVTLTQELHGKKRLKPLTSYAFLAKLPICEIVIGEFSVIAANFPIFFLEREGSFAPTALMSLIDGQNMFVEPDGKWSGLYMPANFRRYPFQIGPGEVNGQPGPVLMIDEAEMSDTDGEMIFAETEAEQPNSPLGRAIRLIAESDQSYVQTRSMVKELQDAGLIQPANLEATLDGQPLRVGGLFGVDEKLLRDLPDETFLALRKSGALALAHMQLQSVAQVQRLIYRHQLRNAAGHGGLPPGALLN